MIDDFDERKRKQKDYLNSVRNLEGLFNNQPLRWLTHQDVFKKACNIIHNYKYDYSDTEIKSQRDPIKIKCPIHGEFIQKADDHLRGHGCPKCAGNASMTKEDFEKSMDDTYGDLYDYSEFDFINDSNSSYIKCNRCGRKFLTSARRLLKLHQGCRYCNNMESIRKRMPTTEDFIKKAKQVHGDFYDYSKSVYTNSKGKVTIICPIKGHGEFNQIANNHLNGEGCPICRASKGEKLVSEFLESENIYFVRQKSFEDCRYKRVLKFDFYLPDYNICIEYQGKQHYDITAFGFRRKEENERSLVRDNVKRNFCRLKGIYLIEIPYDEPIEKYFSLILEIINSNKK